MELADIKAEASSSNDQVNRLARLLKWIIALDLVICVLLFLPDQTREFYRITVVSSLRDSAWLIFWVMLTGALTWFAAKQIAVEARSQIKAPRPIVDLLIEAAPIVLGVLPIVAAAAAQLVSIPDPPKASDNMMEVGSIIRIQARELEDNKAALQVMSAILAFAALMVGLVTWQLGRMEAAKRLFVSLNAQYFSRPRTLLVAAALIATFTTLFVTFPVGFPQALGIFGIVAIFTLCASMFVTHVTLLTDHYQVALLPMVLLLAAAIAAFDLNDNHTARPLNKSDQIAAAEPVLKDAGEAFVDWLKRPDRQTYMKRPGAARYPVFVVSAQGGGAYAAYNTAVFLARMQDLCPSFRHHLFAVSSVSGGSVGAATFAAALNVDQPTASTGAADESCLQIVRFLQKERVIRNLGKQGPVEKRVHEILEADLLSPLVAATLFPDFTQAFTPYPIPPFDRARAIEYALEAAGQKMIEKATNGVTKQTLLEKNYFDHWSSQKSSPALLLNATDAGSGKRVVIAPFQLKESQRFDEELCLLANSEEEGQKSNAEIQDTSVSKAERKTTLKGVALPLSTAAFISARFPWVSPAATVKIKNPCFGKGDKVRLVDGGYLDNSGVETALDLINKIRSSLEKARKIDSSIPQAAIHLISLTGGDFPTRTSFAFDDIAEPIRALMSGREARAYIALNRAKAAVLDIPANSQTTTFERTDLRGMFYRLPLGWSLSGKTRNIIGHESGRFWDCEPGTDYSQTRSFLSNSDCIQMNVHFRISGSMDAATEDLKAAGKFKADFKSTDDPKLNHEKLLICYEDWWSEQRKAAWTKANLSTARALLASVGYQREYFSYFQAEQVRELLREWDSLKETDPNVLAYVMAALSWDTSEFQRTAELLTFATVQDLNDIWARTLDAIDTKSKNMSPPAPAIDRTKLLNNAKEVARVVWQKRYGNTSDDDTWKYRSRGLFQIVGREQYEKMKRWTNYDFVAKPDAISNRRASAKVAFAHYLTWPSSQPGTSRPIDLVRGQNPDWKTARTRNADGEHEDVDEIIKRSEMFRGCIKAAPPLPAK